MNVIKMTGTNCTTSAPGRKIQYLAIHYSAGTSCAPGQGAGLISWFRNPQADGSADYVCDERDFYQYNPDPHNRYCWAVGSKSRYNTKGGRLWKVATNQNCISLEIVSGNKTGKITYPNDPNYYFTTAVIAKAIECTKYLMDLYNIDADHVIRHYDCSGKECPGIIGWNADSGSEDAWNSFHEAIGGAPIKWFRVRFSWDQPGTQIGAYINYDKAKEDCDAHPGFSVYDDDGKCLYTSKAPEPGKYPKGIPASKEAYIAACGEIAKALMAETGILASVVTAQCCLETGFGLGEDSVPLMQPDVNNLLGMKKDLINSTWSQYSVWHGESIKKRTPEYRDGKLIYIDDYFRKYTDYENCIRDYEMFLSWVKNDKGYKYRRIIGMTDPAAVIHAIRIGTGTDAHPEGYCTDPAYEGKILSLIKQYNLQQYDTAGPAPEPQPEPTPTGKKYRVRVGIYKQLRYMEALMARIKEVTGLDCFAETHKDGMHVYCGSYNKKENAEERAQLLNKAGFKTEIEEA